MSRFIVISIISLSIYINIRLWEIYFLKKGMSKKRTDIYTIMFTLIIVVFICFIISFFFGKYIR